MVGGGIRTLGDCRSEETTPSIVCVYIYISYFQRNRCACLISLDELEKVTMETCHVTIT